MPAGFVSSVYDYRLWFANATTPTYITLDRIKRNPLKKTSSYHTGTYYYSPWFDAGYPVSDKVALATRAFVKNTASGRTVAVSYKLNKADLTLDSNLTSLVTLGAAHAGVETKTTFGSNLGALFKSIMFKFVLTTADSAQTPDLIYFMLEYERVIPPRWGWGFTVDCTKEYAGKTSTQLIDALATAAETQLLVPFYYKDVAKYVRVKNVQGSRLTGNKVFGLFDVFVTEK